MVVAITCAAAGQAYAHAHHARSSHRHWTHAAQRLAAAAAEPRVIQCVAFAKQDAGIEISGNARDWWGRAAGIYQRGQRPEPGSVLSFLPNMRMPLGHVAVVAGTLDGRTITIDQSHWNSRGITRDIVVKDVSEDNDWTAVRVQLGRSSEFGAIYPTHGFIYPRPDAGTLVANATRAPVPALDPAPADLRRVRPRRADLEVAEAPASSRPLDLTVPGLSFDAPSRGLR